MMTITDLMAETLARIIQFEPELGIEIQDNNLSHEQIALRLIKTYRNTIDLECRQLIMDFMTDAGYVWLRRLFTRNDESDLEFAAAAA